MGMLLGNPAGLSSVKGRADDQSARHHLSERTRKGSSQTRESAGLAHMEAKNCRKLQCAGNSCCPAIVG
jgi:hypothetical protein